MPRPALAPTPRPPPTDVAALEHHYNGSRAVYDGWSRAGHMHHGYAAFGGPWTHEGMLDAMVDRVVDDLALRDDARVADLGCGYGATAARIVRSKPGVSVDAVTILEEQVAHMEAHPVDGRTPLLADYCDTGLEEDGYDGAFFLESIDYGTGAGKADAVAEAARLLRPGGRLVVAGPFLTGRPGGPLGALICAVERAFAITCFAETGAFEHALHHHGFVLERNELASFHIAPTVVVGHLRAAALIARRAWQGRWLSDDESAHLRGGFLGVWLGLCLWAFQYRIYTARRA